MATTLPRTNLNEHVYDTLRRRLLTRAPGPGAKLSLHEMASELGVSRSPVHHALTRLVCYYVTPVTSQALVDGYDVRLGLELHAAERTVGRLDADQLERFRLLMEAASAALSHEEWDAANAAFHEYQIDLVGNRLLSRFYRELSVNLMMQVIRGGRLERSEELTTEHRRILDAFEAGDVAAAKTAIDVHIATGRRIALEAIERAGGLL
jgi:DNA-binding GntR family transcriptional regulator